MSLDAPQNTRYYEVLDLCPSVVDPWVSCICKPVWPRDELESGRRWVDDCHHQGHDHTHRRGTARDPAGRDLPLPRTVKWSARLSNILSATDLAEKVPGTSCSPHSNRGRINHGAGEVHLNGMRTVAVQSGLKD